MSWIATAIAGSAIGGIAQGAGSYFGSQAQASAIQSGISQMMGLAQPYVAAGKSALPTLSRLLTPGPDQNAVLSQTPGFQFAQDWGQKGILNAGTARGLGGNVMAESGKYASGLASQNYGNIVNQLLSMAGIGAGAASGA